MNVTVDKERLFLVSENERDERLLAWLLNEFETVGFGKHGVTGDVLHIALPLKRKHREKQDARIKPSKAEAIRRYIADRENQACSRKTT